MWGLGGVEVERHSVGGLCRMLRKLPEENYIKPVPDKSGNWGEILSITRGSFPNMYSAQIPETCLGLQDHIL